MITYLNCNYKEGNKFILNNEYKIIKNENYSNYIKLTTNKININ